MHNSRYAFLPAYTAQCVQRAFNNLSVGALVEKKILCMHGGLSPNIETLDDIRAQQKPIRNPFIVCVAELPLLNCGFRELSTTCFGRTLNRASTSGGSVHAAPDSASVRR